MRAQGSDRLCRGARARLGHSLSLSPSCPSRVVSVSTLRSCEDARRSVRVQHGERPRPVSAGCAPDAVRSVSAVLADILLREGGAYLDTDAGQRKGFLLSFFLTAPLPHPPFTWKRGEDKKSRPRRKGMR